MSKERKPNKKAILESQWRNQYPNYAKIWEGKKPSIEDIRVESPHLAKAVELNPELVQEGMFDFNLDGEVIFDALVSVRNTWERPKGR